jgi:hypothetical protein
MLKLTTVWDDPDLIECRVDAKSARFAGSALFYFTEEILREFAQRLAGFPVSTSDSRSFATKNSEDGNSLVVSLSCYSGLGAAGASVQIIDREDTREAAQIVFRVEPAALDVFAEELRLIASSRSGDATLRSVVL